MRAAAGYSQNEFAELLGVSAKTLWTWEKDIDGMRIDVLRRVCELLKCTPNELIGWYDDHDRDIKSELPSITYAVVELMDECTPERKAQVYSYAADCAALSKNGAQGAAVSQVA